MLKKGEKEKSLSFNKLYNYFIKCLLENTNKKFDTDNNYTLKY